jgi:hypothetical protein
MTQYVCVRITRMDDVDIGLFEHDRNNTLYFYMLNAEEQIYMRYGGRDSRSPDSYLDLKSIELALAKGLELHRLHQDGKLAGPARPKPDFPRAYPLLVERTFARNACVECHLIGDFQNMHRELDGTLDKPKHLWRSPDIRTIGIELDVPKGLAVKEATGAVAEAGMRAGDTIAAVNGTPVYTFGDLQHYYDKIPREATSAKIAVERDGERVELTVALPVRWWVTDARWRQSSVDPRTYFDSRPLTVEEKKAHGLKTEGFASEVTYIDRFAEAMKSHELKKGDVVYGVDGVEADPVANTAELYIKIHKKAGDSMKLQVLRGGSRIETGLKTFRMSFRK